MSQFIPVPTRSVMLPQEWPSSWGVAVCSTQTSKNADPWFSSDEVVVTLVKKICENNCPLLQVCREWAIHGPDAPQGVAGGMSEAEIKKARRHIRRWKSA